VPHLSRDRDRAEGKKGGKGRSYRGAAPVPPPYRDRDQDSAAKAGRMLGVRRAPFTGGNLALDRSQIGLRQICFRQWRATKGPAPVPELSRDRDRAEGKKGRPKKSDGTGAVTSDRRQRSSAAKAGRMLGVSARSVRNAARPQGV
jgi:hypothetical protein